MNVRRCFGYLLFILLILFSYKGSCEGTKQLLPDSTVSGAGLFIDNTNSGIYTKFALANCLPNYRLNIHIKNPGESILFGFQFPYSSINYNLRKSNGTIVMTGTCPYYTPQPGYITYYHQAIVGPFPQQGGYTPLQYTVTNIADTGNYYFELSTIYNYQFIIDYWDFQVVSGQHTPAIPADTINGRVWSQSWQVYAYLASPFQPFSGNFYVYSDDGMVTRLGFSGAHVGAVTIFCNQYGCLNTGNFNSDRQSMNTNTFTSFPGIAQYKVFLNNPDPTVYPSGIIGEILPTPYLIPDPNYPVCSGRKYIVVNVNKAGNVEIAILFPYGAPATNVALYAAVNQGINNIPWDGKDGTGNMAPDGTLITFNIKLLNGLTNLPIWDQEQNPNGYSITLIRPVAPGLTVPTTFWDDTQLIPGTYLGDPCTNPPQTANLTGCTPGSIPGYAGCHPWAPNGPDCHNKMINTWWFGSTNTSTFTTLFTQTPPNPTGQGDSRCGPGSLILHATVLPTETVDWYTVPTGGTPILVGNTTLITPVLTVTTTYYAQARSTISNCLSTLRVPVVATINPVPQPTISGPTSVCAGTTGNIYMTQPGMAAYTWTISPGGVITSGSGTNAITVTWTAVGAQNVTVTCTNSAGCSALAPAVMVVTVNSIPVPTLSGPTSICSNSGNSTYTTQPGMINYNWVVSPGGSIISGGTSSSSSVTVNWITAGTQSVSVSYTSPAGCPAAAPAVVSVVVNPTPVPSLNGPITVCQNTSMSVYNTQPGMTGYIWIVSPGGVITAGGTSSSSSVTINWITTGPQSVSVSYTSPAGCPAAAPAVVNVMVNPLPVPTITGTPAVCQNSGGTYSTQAGMTGYSWAVSAGGIITTGSGTNSITVKWMIPGAQIVSVNYFNSSGCTALAPTLFNVMVYPLPVPSLAGPGAVCKNSTGNVYSTQPGMTGYTWIVSSGGVITSGGTTASNSVTVTWISTGAQFVSVNYTSQNGCPGVSPAVVNVFVNSIPVPSITGPSSVCANSTAGYSTEPGMNSYTWTVSPGGTITTGAGTNVITVHWVVPGTQSVTVTYTDYNGCIPITPTVFNVTVYPLPVPVIYGPTPVCLYSFGNTYTTQPGMTNYSWSVSAGGTVTGGGTSTSDSITITWNATGFQSLIVTYIDSMGCPTAEPGYFAVKVNPLPVPVISGTDSICEGSTGTIYSTQAGMTGYTWTISFGGTITSGEGTDSIAVTWNIPGQQFVTVTYTSPDGCPALMPDTLFVSVHPRPGPAGTISGPDRICVPTNNVIYSILPVLNATWYSWNLPMGVTLVSGAGTNIITVNFGPGSSSGTFTVFATNSCGSGALSPPFEVIVHQPPSANAGPDGSTCEGTPFTISAASASNYSGLLWFTSGSGTLIGSNTLTPTYTPSINDSGSITFTLVATGNPPCGNDTAGMELHIIRKPSVNAGPDMISCSIYPVILNGAQASYYAGFSWNTSGDGTFNDQTLLHPTYIPGPGDVVSGHVSLMLTAAAISPCTEKTDTISLTIFQQATAYAGEDGSICKGDHYLLADAFTGHAVSTVWSTTGSGTFSDPANLHPLFNPGEDDLQQGFALLILTVTSAAPCLPVSDTLHLAFYAAPVADAGKDDSIPYGTSDTLVGQASGGSGNFSFEWEPASLFLNNLIQNPVTQILTMDTIFILVVTDQETGCRSSDTIRIKIVHSNILPDEGCITVHNVITPNGDGFNDVWVIDCIESYPDNTVELFNRWGDPVNRFERYDNSMNVWKGTNFNGDPMPDGTYYYVLKIKDKVSKSGWVYIRGGSR